MIKLCVEEMGGREANMAKASGWKGENANF